jgi:hypothetical protein
MRELFDPSLGNDYWKLGLGIRMRGIIRIG